METLDGTLKSLMIGTDHWKDQDVSRRKVEYCILQRNRSQRDRIRKSSLHIQMLHPLGW